MNLYLEKLNVAVAKISSKFEKDMPKAQARDQKAGGAAHAKACVDKAVEELKVHIYT